MKEPKKMGFEFSDVSLQEAQLLADAGSGIYSDLILTLTKEIPEHEKFNMGQPIEKRKTLKFSLPGNKVMAIKITKNLCMSVNNGLKKQGLSWTVHYIARVKAFVCIPKKEGRISDKRDRNAKILEMIRQGASIPEIRKSFGISNYVIWKARKEANLEIKPTGKTTASPVDTAKLRALVLDLKAKGMRAADIARQMKMKVGRINHYFYSK